MKTLEASLELVEPGRVHIAVFTKLPSPHRVSWPDPYFNSKSALLKADLQNAQSLYESVKAKKESRFKWMRRNKGGDAIIDYVRKRIMQDVRNYEARARQRSRR